MDSDRSLADSSGEKTSVVGKSEHGAERPSLVGAVLGAFEITSVLGEGGMGRVYAARHRVIGRKAAIKVLNAEVAGNDDVVARFFNEARAVNDIRHPNIVEVTDLGTYKNQPYIVMEHLEGETLGERIDRVRVLDEESALRISGQIASALGAAHERGLVHRDLKPANIFLRHHPDYPDFVKLLDFGIAKLLVGKQAEAALQHKTQAGSILGTPAYMSPEQCLGDAKLDHRSDIYSLGVVLYYMVTGKLPFEADSFGRLVMLHVTEPAVPPKIINDRISPELNTIILRALEKRPVKRYAHMREMREALASAGGRDRSLTPPPVVLAPVAAPQRGDAPTERKAEPSRSDGVPRAELRDPTMMAPGPQLPGLVPPPLGAPKPPPTPAVGGAVSAPTMLSVVGIERGLVEAARRDVIAEKLSSIVRSRVASGLLPLPELAPRIQRCLALSASPAFSFPAVAAILSEEPRLVSQLLQTANKPSFNGRSPAVRLEQAIGRLGAIGVRTALVELALRPVLEVKQPPRIEEAFRKPWLHALAVAFIAQRIVSLAGRADLETEAYLAGLFRDAGRPIVAALLIEVERQLDNSRGRRLLDEQRWYATVEVTHAPVGAALVRQWRLPEPVARAVEQGAAYEARGGVTLTNVARLAGALAARNGFHIVPDEPQGALATLEEGKQLLGLDEDLLRRAVQGVRSTLFRL